MNRVREAGYELGNIDATVVAQAPRLAPWIDAMTQRLAQALTVPVTAINLKAKTTERLGFEGRGEGISAQAVALIERQA
jgi:2-C-methyl-D-erythritol 2,4-cyclodiphosphate synthase